jgi:hypothetical protein
MAANALSITADDSRLGLWVIPTDEERMIAWYTARTLAESDQCTASLRVPDWSETLI